MKKFIISALFTAAGLACFSQSSLYISTGANVVVTPGASLVVDSFAIKPSAAYTIPGANSVTRDAVTTTPTPTAHINRVYHFLNLLPAFTGEITHYYRDAELNGISENLLNLSLYNGTAWIMYPPSAQDNVNNFVRTSGLTNVVFNEATLSQGQVVPVTLTNVKAYQKNSGVQVEWRAEQEINIEKYEVERSQNGRQFSSIGTIAAKGNSGGVTDYSLYDAKPNSGINYYRLKITDNDGQVKYSSVLKVNIASGSGYITVYPNPATGNSIGLQINNLPKGIYTISVTNKAGQLIANKILNHLGGSATESVEFSKAIAAGVYHVRIMGESVNVTEEVIKR